MVSPARAHFIKHSAMAAAHAAQDNAPRADLNQYELHLAQLSEHRRRLHQIKSVERKIEFKRSVLPEYVPYINGILEADADVEQDDVVTTVMVWCIDAGDIEGALNIASYALKHNLPLPDQYKRDAACVIAEEIAEHALAAITHDPAAANDAMVKHLALTAELVKGRDMPDEVLAKLHKAIGYALRTIDPAAALQELERALQLNDKCGVKKDIERLQRDIKNNPPESSPPTPETSDVAAGNHTPAGTEASGT